MTVDVLAFRMRLSCGCEIDHGPISAGMCSALTPRRKDGSLGAAKCRHGSRRVIYTVSTSSGVSGETPE